MAISGADLSGKGCGISKQTQALRSLLILRPLARTLYTHHNTHNLRTIQDIILRWAPPAENRTDSYIRSKSAFVGVPHYQAIEIRDNEQTRAMMRGIIRQEHVANAGDLYSKVALLETQKFSLQSFQNWPEFTQLICWKLSENIT